MTPIDDELRTSLRRQADGVTPLADPLAGVERRASQIRRRRMATAVSGAALTVVAVALTVPQLVSSQTSSRYAGGALSPLSPAVTPSDRVDPPPPANLLRWPTRAAAMPAIAEVQFEAGIARLWAAKHSADSRNNKLWGAGLPGGGVAGIWQFWTLGSPTAHTVVGQRLPDGRTFIVLDQVTPKGVKEISSVLAGGAFPHVVVLGPPTTGQIGYDENGQKRFRPVEHLQGFVGGDGWAVFDRTGPGVSKRPDLIELLDGDGRWIYRGQIDVGPSSPDV